MSGLTLDRTGLAGNSASPVHRLDPRVKIAGLTGVSLLAVTTPLAAWPALAGCALALGALAACARVSPGALWRRIRVVVPLVALVVVLLPLVREGGASWSVGPLTLHEAGLAVAVAVAAKTAIGATGAALLGATTAVPDVLRGLEGLRLPRLFVLIAGFMHRYLFVIADEVRRMRAALAARGYNPRIALQSAAAGRVAGALFLRTYDRAERVHRAMLARGYSGRMPETAPLALGRSDLLFICMLAGTLLPLRALAEVAAG